MTPGEIAAALRALPCEQLWAALGAAKVLHEWEYFDDEGRAYDEDDNDEHEDPAWARCDEMQMLDLSGRCVASARRRYPDKHWRIVVDGKVAPTTVALDDDPRPVVEAAAEAAGWRLSWRD